MKEKRPPITPAALRVRHFFITIFFLAVAVFFSVYFIGYCRVQRVSVKVGPLVPEPSVLDAVEIKAGTHLFAINEEKIEAKLVEANPYIKSVNLKRKLPGELQIFVEEYVLSYYIIYAEKYYLLTDGLMVLEETTPEEAKEKGAIPLLIPKLADPKATKEEPDPPKVLTPHKTIAFASKEDLTWVKKLLSAMHETSFAKEITEIDLSDPFSIRIKLGEKYTVRLGNERDLAKKLARTEHALLYLKDTMYALKGVIYAETDAPVTFTFDGVIEENNA